MGKVYAFFIDLKSAFDKVSRGDFWKSMKERGIRKGIVERIKELYEETENIISTETNTAKLSGRKEALDRDAS